MDLPDDFAVVLLTPPLDPMGAPQQALDRIGRLAGIGATEVSCVISARSSAHFRDQLSALAELADLPGRWQIVTQITRMLDGAAEGRALLVDGLSGRIR